jgi:hypothetical protein
MRKERLIKPTPNSESTETEGQKKYRFVAWLIKVKHYTRDEARLICWRVWEEDKARATQDSDLMEEALNLEKEFFKMVRFK